MSGLINELVTVLSKQAENYENLLALSIEKKDVIVQNDVLVLQKITNIESSIVSQNRKLEKARIQIVNDVAMVLGKEENELDFTSLLETIKGQEEHNQLEEVGKRIKTAVEELADVNEQNKNLIYSALDYIDFSINLMQGTISSGSGSFSTSQSDNNSGNIFFDAKQ